MKTLTTVLKGGELSKQSWLYRFLTRWTPEYASKMEDSCQLRAALILAGLRILKKPAVWLLLAVAVMIALVLVVFLLALIGLCVGEFASDRIPGTIPAKLYDDFIYNPFPVVLVHLGGLGIGTLLLAAILIAPFGFGLWRAVRRWPIVEPLLYLMLTTALCIFAIWTLFTTGSTAALIAIVVWAVLAVIVGASIIGGYLAVAHLRRWLAETHFWAWLKGHLCLPVQLTD